MIVTTRARFDKYIELHSESKYLIFPSCTIDIKGKKKTVVSKVAVADKLYKENQPVLIQYDTENIENFAILEAIDDKKIIISSILIILCILLLWFLVQNYGITVTHPTVV